MTENNLPIPQPEQNSVLSLRRTNQLIDITDKILARSRQELAFQDESWMTRLWAWADENEVPDLRWVARKAHLKGGWWEGLPRERSALLGLQELWLRQMHLTSLPTEIGQLQQLQTLELLDNKLTRLPPEIGQLQQLQSLNLGINKLTSLPSEIGNLQHLQTLGLESNDLTSLPPEIGQLQQLRNLWLEGNHITSIPPEIERLDSLTICL